MSKPHFLLVAVALLLWPRAAEAQFDPDRQVLPQRQAERQILHVPGRSGRGNKAYFQNGISETTYYSGADRGEVRVEARGSRSGAGPTLSLLKPSQAGIHAELAREFPGESMSVVRTPIRNAYGPVGMAANERCVYAWQWIDSVSRVPDAGDRLFSSPSARPASVRVKLCRRGGESIAQLMRAVQGLRLFGAASIQAARPARAPSRAAARPTGPDAPVAAAAPREPEALRPIAPMPAPPSRTGPAGGYASVPLPSQAQPVGQRPFVTSPDRPVIQPDRVPVAPQPAPVRSPTASPVPVPAPAGSAETRRYITDRPGAEGEPATIVPRPARGGGAPETAEPFTGGLPPEAYRGPGR